MRLAPGAMLGPYESAGLAPECRVVLFDESFQQTSAVPGLAEAKGTDRPTFIIDRAHGEFDGWTVRA